MQLLLLEELPARHRRMYGHRNALLRSMTRRVDAPAICEDVTKEPLPGCQAAGSIVGCLEALSE